MRKQIGGTLSVEKQKEVVKSDIRCGRFEGESR